MDVKKEDAACLWPACDAWWKVSRLYGVLRTGCGSWNRVTNSLADFTGEQVIVIACIIGIIDSIQGGGGGRGEPVEGIVDYLGGYKEKEKRGKYDVKEEEERQRLKAPQKRKISYGFVRQFGAPLNMFLPLLPNNP